MNSAVHLYMRILAAVSVRVGCVTLLLLAGVVSTPSGLAAQEPASLTAYPVEPSISVDARLDEAAWEQAEVASGFRQFEPNEGAPASQRTEVRVLYGANSLYIGAILHDQDPAQIEQALGRRDEFNRADWFLVSIDSDGDRRTAYTFGVNAAGVQFDALRTGAGGGGPGGGGGRGGGGGGGGLPGMDASWDAIWYSAVRVTSEGWHVEMRIPYSMLRFSGADAQTWGVHFTRRIPRLGEQSEWPLVPRTARTNLVEQFGVLTGITGIEPRRNVQIRPYALSQLQSRERIDAPGTGSTDGDINIGADVKVGLGSNVTLDATINPDFGQVESDPAVLNLTAFETVLDERRPFFVEGIQIYQFGVGPGRLLYTRRIGAEAPIIGAAKLSGRTGNGLSFGLLGATTGDDFGPERHYGVARLSQQIGAVSSLGGIVTAFDGAAVRGDGRQRSMVGGADWDIRFLNNQYGIEGFSAVTHRQSTQTDRAAETGFAGQLFARKRQGAWKGFVGASVFSDEFNPNDLGQLRQNNFSAFLTNISHDINGGRPFGPFLRASADAFAVQQLSYLGGLDLGQNLNLGSRWMLQSFQQIRLGATFRNLFGGYNLYETRGLGPWAQPFSTEIRGSFQTDERRSWQLEPGLSLTANGDGGRGYGVGLEARGTFGTRLSLSGEAAGRWEDGINAWSSNEVFRRTDDGWMIGTVAGSPNRLGADDYVLFDDAGLLDAILAGVTPLDGNRYFVPVFGSRDTRSLDFNLRSTLTFTPTLALQLYSQLFLARGSYDRFQILQNRDELAPFDAFPKRAEFALSNLQSNAVLRWEYRPGSTLSFVWTHGRRADDRLNPLAPWGSSPYDRRVGEQIDNLFGIFPDNVFLIKFDYTFLR